MPARRDRPNKSRSVPARGAPVGALAHAGEPDLARDAWDANAPSHCDDSDKAVTVIDSWPRGEGAVSVAWVESAEGIAAPRPPLLQVEVTRASGSRFHLRFSRHEWRALQGAIGVAIARGEAEGLDTRDRTYSTKGGR